MGTGLVSGRGDWWGEKKKCFKHSSNLFKGGKGKKSTSICFRGHQQGGEGKDLSLCGWVEQVALIRHVWTEVILDVSHTPACQLVLGQVQAEAAQLEDCGLGLRSLKESEILKGWVTKSLSFPLSRRAADNFRRLTNLQVLSIHEEKYGLIWVVHDHSSLVLTT